jgi:hypothetical protein
MRIYSVSARGSDGVIHKHQSQILVKSPELLRCVYIS